MCTKFENSSLKKRIFAGHIHTLMAFGRWTNEIRIRITEGSLYITVTIVVTQ